jgi:hypothetical protein
VIVGSGVGVGVGLGVGCSSQELNVDALLRGAGAAVWKSEALSPVSEQPSFCLCAEVVFPGAGAGAAPSKQTALEP